MHYFEYYPFLLTYPFHLRYYFNPFISGHRRSSPVIKINVIKIFHSPVISGHPRTSAESSVIPLFRQVLVTNKNDIKWTLQENRSGRNSRFFPKNYLRRQNYAPIKRKRINDFLVVLPFNILAEWEFYPNRSMNLKSRSLTTSKALRTSTVNKELIERAALG